MKNIVALTLLTLSTTSAFAQLLTDKEVISRLASYCETERAITEKAEVSCRNSVAKADISSFEACVDSTVRTKLTSCINEVQADAELRASLL